MCVYFVDIAVYFWSMDLYQLLKRIGVASGNFEDPPPNWLLSGYCYLYPSLFEQKMGHDAIQIIKIIIDTNMGCRHAKIFREGGTNHKLAFNEWINHKLIVQTLCFNSQFVS